MFSCGKPSNEVNGTRAPREPAPPIEPQLASAQPAPAQNPPPPAPPSDAAPTVKTWKLAIQPLGKIGKRDVATVRSSIAEVYAWEVEVLPGRDHPEEAWYAKRKRWRAEKILDWMRPLLPAGSDRIMALTADDISTTKGDVYDWGICGLADLDGAATVVSTFRIKKGLGKGAKARDKKYHRRLRDLTTHEFGHTLGLPHCPNRGCILEDAKGTVKTFDWSTGKLCDDCLKQLAEAGFEMP